MQKAGQVCLLYILFVFCHAHFILKEQNSVQLQLVRVFDTDLPEYDNKVLCSSNNFPCFVSIGPAVLFHIFPKKDHFPSKKVIKKH